MREKSSPDILLEIPNNLGERGGCLKRRLQNLLPKEKFPTILGKGAAAWQGFSRHLFRSPETSWRKGGGCLKGSSQVDLPTKTEVPNRGGEGERGRAAFGLPGLVGAS